MTPSTEGPADFPSARFRPTALLWNAWSTTSNQLGSIYGRYPSDSEATTDRFDDQGSDQARSIAEQVLKFAKNSIRP